MQSNKLFSPKSFLEFNSSPQLFKFNELVYFQYVLLENFQSTSHVNINEVHCQTVSKHMLENTHFYYSLSSTQEIYWLPPVQCQDSKNGKQYLINSRQDIISILDYPTTLSCIAGEWKGQKRLQTIIIFSHEYGLWLSKFTWCEMLETFDRLNAN